MKSRGATEKRSKVSLGTRVSRVAFRPTTNAVALNQAVQTYGIEEGYLRFKYPGTYKGVLRGTIIGAGIWAPDAAEGGDLMYIEGLGASFAGYDFCKNVELPPPVGMKMESRHIGSLVAYFIAEVAGNDADESTPTSLFDIRNRDHLRAGRPTGIGECVHEGLLRLTTLLQAYTDVGLDGQYGEALAEHGCADDPVYQVTPKGNTLIWFSYQSSGGPSRPRRIQDPTLRPSPLSDPAAAYAS